MVDLQHMLSLSKSSFFEDYFEQQIYYKNRANDLYFAEILQLEDLDYLFQQKIHPQRLVRMANANKNKDSFVSLTKKVGDFTYWNTAKIFESFANKKESIILHRIQDYLPKIGQLVNQLEKDLHFRVNVNAYITPPNAQAFDPHYDPHDTFILQIYGQKTWYLYDRVLQFPDARHTINYPSLSKYTKDNYNKKINIQTGDTLYVPSGWAHCVVSSDLPSVHLTVGLHPKKKFDVFQIMNRLSMDKSHFRRAYPSFAPTSTRLAEISELKRQYIDFIKNISEKEILQLMEIDFLTKETNQAENRFVELIKQHEIVETSQFQIRKGLSYKLDFSDNKIVLYLKEKKMPYPIFFKPIFTFFEEGVVFGVEDLPTDFSKTQKLSLLKLLVKEGFLTIVSF